LEKSGEKGVKAIC